MYQLLFIFNSAKQEFEWNIQKVKSKHNKIWLFQNEFSIEPSVTASNWVKPTLSYTNFYLTFVENWHTINALIISYRFIMILLYLTNKMYR